MLLFLDGLLWLGGYDWNVFPDFGEVDVGEVLADVETDAAADNKRSDVPDDFFIEVHNYNRKK